MVSKIQEETREQIYNLWLSGYNPREIGKKLSIPRSTVDWHIRKIEGTIDYRLSQVAIKEFTRTYIKVQDAITQQIKELADVKAECEATIAITGEQLKEIEEELKSTEDPKELKKIKARWKQVRSDHFGARGLWLSLQNMIKERHLDIFQLQGDGQSVMALRKLKRKAQELEEENGETTKVPPSTA